VSGRSIPGLIDTIIHQIRARDPEGAALIGIGGAQGSGKSYQCRVLEAANRGRYAHFSLDDVYLTHAERAQMAADFHPLCITRGPPGTHDLDLADATIGALETAEPRARTPLPRFDKLKDDRAPIGTWPLFVGPPEAILVDGWLMGALEMDEAQFEPPLNALEAEEDADGKWRGFSLALLATDYARFFDAFDALIYLKAPSWSIVRTWRGQQEEEALGRTLNAEENAALDRFVAHYERVTRAMLAGHHRADWIVHLDQKRNVVRVEER